METSQKSSVNETLKMQLSKLQSQLKEMKKKQAGKTHKEFIELKLTKLLFGKAQFGCALIRDDKFQYLNKKFTEILGYKISDIPTTEVWFQKAYRDSKKRSKIIKILNEGLSSGKKEFTRTFDVCHKNGSIKSIKFHDNLLPENYVLMYIEDVTELKEKKSELNQTSKLFEEIFFASNDAIYLWQLTKDKKLKLQEVNKAAENILGYSRDELFRMTPFDLNTIETQKIVKENFNKILKEGSTRFSTKHLCKSGKIIDVEVNSRLIKINNQRYILSIVRDFSEFYSQQKRLAESEDKYNRVINSMPFGVHLYELKDNDLIFIGYNNAANQILRIDNKIFLGKKLEDAFPPLAKTEIPERYKFVALTGNSWQNIFFNYQDEKLSGIFNINAFQIAKNKMAATFFDISEQVLSEKALREAEERYKTFINQINEGIWRVDFENPIPVDLPIEEQITKLMTESKVGECNEIFAKMYGYNSIEEIMGKSLLDLYGGKLNELNSHANIQFIKANYRIANASTTEITKDGQLKHFLSNAFGIVKDNFLINIWGTQLDITQSKIIENTNSILANIIESTSDFVITFEETGKIVYMNEAVKKSLGIKNDDLNPLNIKDLFLQSSFEKISKEGINVALKYGLWQGEAEIFGSIKNELPCSIVLIPQRPLEETIQYYSAIIRDISERIQFENELRENQIKFRTIFDNSFDGMILMHYDNIIDCNSTTEVLFDCEKKEIISRTPFYFSPEFQRNGLKSETYGISLIEKAYNGEELFFEWQHRSANGKLFDTEVSLKKISYGKSNFLLGIIHDITNNKIALESLKKSEELNRRLVESSPMGIIYVDYKGFISYENSASLQMMGLDPSKPSPLIGKNLLDLPGLKSLETYELLKKLMGGATLRNEELKFKSISQKDLDIRIFAAPILNDEHKYIGAIIMFQDITETVKMRNALAETEGKLKLVINNSPVLAYEIDTNGKITFWESKGIKDIDANGTEMIGKSLFEEFKDYPEFVEDNRNALLGNTISSLYKINNVDIDSHISPLLSQKNNVLGVLGIAFDITERKKKDDILKNLSVGISTRTGKEFIDAVLEYLAGIFNIDMIFVGEIQKEEKVSTISVCQNGKLEENFEYTLSETPCQNVFKKSSTFCNGDVQGKYPKDKFLVDLGINSYFGITLFDSHQNPNGIFVALKKTLFDNPEFLESVMRIFALRISAELERIKYEKGMIEAINAAENANKMKSEFLAQMSHEIRTPINTILSFANLIKEDLAEYINDDLRPSFAAMENASRRIIRTIELILNMAEISTGSYIPEFREFSLVDIIENVYLEMLLLAKNKGIKLVLSTSDDKLLVTADNYSVGQIINNLVDNAIKYTPSGSIEIRSDRNEAGQVFVVISDTGIGISKEYLPFLFTAFSQEETGYTRKFEGNGLGLALVKRYCEINNATVEVESEKNVGTKFTVTFHCGNLAQN